LEIQHSTEEHTFQLLYVQNENFKTILFHTVKTHFTLWAGRAGFDTQQGHGRNLFFDHRFQIGSVAHPASYQTCTSSSQSETRDGRGMNLTTDLHLVLKLKMRAAIPPLPHTSAWRGTWLSTRINLPLLLEAYAK